MDIFDFSKDDREVKKGGGGSDHAVVLSKQPLSRVGDYSIKARLWSDGQSSEFGIGLKTRIREDPYSDSVNCVMLRKDR